MACSKAFFIELPGRDKLHSESYRALVLFSLAVPLWMPTWTICTQLDMVQKSKFEAWHRKLLLCMSVDFVSSMLATGFELARVMGNLVILFAVVAVWVLGQMRHILDDHEPELDSPSNRGPT